MQLENVGFKWESKSAIQETIRDKNPTCLQEFKQQGGNKERPKDYPKSSYLCSCEDKPRPLLCPLKEWKSGYLPTASVKTWENQVLNRCLVRISRSLRQPEAMEWDS